MHVRALLGPAGTGKSTTIRKIQETNRLLLTATTGVAAFNLGDAITINSLMGFFNAESLRNRFLSSSYMSYKYEQLREWDGLVIDEISMMTGEVFEMLMYALNQISGWKEQEGLKPLKILVVGDFLQLPPVFETTPDFAFASNAWAQYLPPEHTQILRTIYRQTDPRFQELLTAARYGDGMAATMRLVQANAEFHDMPWYGYPGFTLYPTNASVNVHNRTCLEALKSRGHVLQTERWGEQDDILKEIPDVINLKDDCRIRVTCNSQPSGSFVNGQLGTLLSYSDEDGPLVLLDPKGSGDAAEPYEVTLPKVVRFAMRPVEAKDNSLLDRTAHMKSQQFRDYMQDHLIPKKVVPFYHPQREMVAIGACQTYPIVLGYASTIHKSQGLTFSQVQIDFRNRFAGNFQSMYVALSRCRSIEGLRLVGDRNTLPRRINTAPAVRQWI